MDFKDQIGLQATELILNSLISVPNPPETPFLNEGDYIRIDMNYTKEHSSGHDFSARSIKKVGFESIDSDGKVSIFGVVAGVSSDILEARQRYAEQASYNRWLAQTES
jgi:hypothetical protein